MSPQFEAALKSTAPSTQGRTKMWKGRTLSVINLEKLLTRFPKMSS